MILTEDLIRLLLAVAAGGLIGLEREFRDKAAGFRTLIFICTGAALFTILSHQLGGVNDPVRIAANIVTGVGFLGAGTILQSRGSVVGLTTAATLWVVAAIGMAVGFGASVEAAGATVLVLIVLIPLRSLEARAEAHQRKSESRKNNHGAGGTADGEF